MHTMSSSACPLDLREPTLFVRGSCSLTQTDVHKVTRATILLVQTRNPQEQTRRRTCSGEPWFPPKGAFQAVQLRSLSAVQRSFLWVPCHVLVSLGFLGWKAQLRRSF